MPTDANIRINGNWPIGDDYTPFHLAHSVLSSFRNITGSEITNSLFVINNPDGETPIVAYDRLADADIIILCIEDSRLWAQISYQLSHELCHILSNFRENKDHKHKWFEEAICELASLHNLLKMAEQWRQTPPFPFMSHYSAFLERYVDEFIAKIAPNMPEDNNFPIWLSQRILHLEQGRYDRPNNAVVAVKLLPLFQGDLKCWKAVGFLNLWQCQADETFEDFLKSWKAQVADDYKNCVCEIGSVLGYKI